MTSELTVDPGGGSGFLLGMAVLLIASVSCSPSPVTEATPDPAFAGHSWRVVEMTPAEARRQAGMLRSAANGMEREAARARAKADSAQNATYSLRRPTEAQRDGARALDVRAERAQISAAQLRLQADRMEESLLANSDTIVVRLANGEFEVTRGKGVLRVAPLDVVAGDTVRFVLTASSSWMHELSAQRDSHLDVSISAGPRFNIVHRFDPAFSASDEVPLTPGSSKTFNAIGVLKDPGEYEIRIAQPFLDEGGPRALPLLLRAWVGAKGGR